MKIPFDKLTNNKLTNNKLAKSQSFRQLVKYGMVGVVGLAIDMGVFFLLVEWLAVHYPFTVTISALLGGNVSVGMLDIHVSNLIGTSLAVVNNFVLNSYFTFHVTDHKWSRFAKFAGIATIGYIIGSFLLTLFIGICDIDPMIAKGIQVFLVAMMQFAINKIFTFKSHKEA